VIRETQQMIIEGKSKISRNKNNKSDEKLTPNMKKLIKVWI